MTERLKYQLLGGVLVVVAALFVAVTIAVYQQDFTPVVHVTLDTDHAGNQLDTGADVKVRGVIVGDVRSITSTGGGAILHLALQPDEADLIPANVTAQLLPKTLFGERYVALVLPAQPATTHLVEGSVIDQDRSSTSIEVEKVLGDVLPLLQAIPPQQLAATLDAMSTALSGQGAQLGHTLVALNTYLTTLEPSLPNINTDIQELTAVATSDNQAAPQLLQALDQLATTSKTLVAEQQNLKTLYAAVTTSGVDLTNFLRVNENNVIDLATSSRPTLDVLARYAPEYPCLLKELVDGIPGADRAFGKGTNHPDSGQFTIVIAASRGKYLPGVDTPRYDDDRGPQCYPETVPPNRFPQYPPGGPVNDGSTHAPPPHGTGDGNFLPDALAGATAVTTPQVANSPAERQLIGALVGTQLGVPPGDVPNWASELVGPVYRGAEVSVR